MRDTGERRLPAWVGIYLRGICMGAADAVPGVSGGTIALVTGIYDRLIAAITAVTPERVVAVLLGPLPGERERARDALRAMDTPFLLALGAGILTAVVVITRVLHYTLERYPVLTFGLFFGLIGASAVVLLTDVSLDTPERAGAAVTGVVLAFVASGRASAALGTGPLATVLAGAIAVSAMVLPGISGSLLLLILGQYARMVETLTLFVDRLIAVPRDGLAPVVEPGATVVAFLLGAVVGLLTVAHGVRRALNHRPETTMAFLVSLVIGALRAPVVRAGERLPGGWSAEAIATFVIAAAVGAGIVVAVDRAT